MYDGIDQGITNLYLFPASASFDIALGHVRCGLASCYDGSAIIVCNDVRSFDSDQFGERGC
jgi:hypothetical protein